MVSLSDEMGERYLIVQPANGGITDLVRYGIFNNKASGSKFLLQQQQQDDDKNKRFVIIVSIIMRKLIKVLGKPMEWAGYVVDFILNLLSLNGGLLPLFANLFQGSFFIIYPN
ncbi:putative triacylglycerol lipase [Helianthus annuus]|nr:putative triacylglycerol lipase [Helianthus annuus]KAJ0713621.1 putative triacylglycerol lipase [Helianthus annuus]